MGRQDEEVFCKNWHILYPIFVAKLESISPEVRSYFDHPVHTRLCFEWFAVLNNFWKWEQIWNFFEKIENTCVPKWLRKKLSAKRPKSENHWKWLNSKQKTLISLCFVNPIECFNQVSRLITNEDLESSDLYGLMFLLSAYFPERMPTLLEAMPAHPEKDRLSVDLIRGHWIPLETAHSLLPMITDRKSRLHAEIMLMLWADNHVSPDILVEKAADLLETQEVKSYDPLLKSLLKSVGMSGQPFSIEPIAHMILATLRSQGVEGAQIALRTWLNLYLCPDYGKKTPDYEQKINVIRDAIQLAQTLRDTKAPSENIGSKSEKTDHGKFGRLIDIYKKWRANQFLYDNIRQLWPDTLADSFQQKAYMLALFFFPFFSALDVVFIRDEGKNKDVFFEILNNSGIMAILLFLLYLINAWTLDSFLSIRTDGENTYKVYLRCCRFLASGIPLLGLYTLDIWKWLLEKKPYWAIKINLKPMRGQLGKRRDFRERTLSLSILFLIQHLRCLATRFASTRYFLVSYILVNVLVLSFWGRCLVESAYLSITRKISIQLLAIFLHGVIFMGMWYHCMNQAKKSRARSIFNFIYYLLPFFWLIPYPALSLGGLIIYFVLVSRASKEALIIYNAYEKQDKLNALPQWSSLEESVRFGWENAPWWRRLRLRPTELDNPIEYTTEEKQTYLFYKVKTLMLVGEATGFAWLMMWFESQWPKMELLTSSILSLAIFGSLLLGILGVGAMICHFLLRATYTKSWLDDWSQHPNPYLQYLAGTQLGFFAGMSIGDCLWNGEYTCIESSVVVIGTICLLYMHLPLILSIFINVPGLKADPSLEMLLWTFLYAGITLTVATGEISKLSDKPVFVIFFFITFLGALFLFVAIQVPWLLRPFKVRDIFNRSSPLGCRCALIFITIVAIFPMGGLCIPVCMFIRRQVLSKYESYLTEEEI